VKSKSKSPIKAKKSPTKAKKSPTKAVSVSSAANVPLCGAADIDDDLLDGLIIVVTGEFMNISRGDLIKFITNKGGKNTGSVSFKTNYLIAGHKLEDGREVFTSGKYKNAKDKRIKILTEDDFEKMI
jgi:NAD-dependent DNA ligase